MSEFKLGERADAARERRLGLRRLGPISAGRGHVFLCWTVQGASRWERYPAAALRLADADEATEAAPKPRLVKGGR